MFDIVVVGAGVIGSSVAYHAARAGARVAVVDAHHDGRATDAGAGILSKIGLDPSEADERWMTLVAACTDQYEAMLDELGEDAAAASDYARVGEVVVARTDEQRSQLAALETRVAAQSGTGSLLGPGTQATRVAGADMTDYWPQIHPDAEGLFISGTARVDGRSLARVLLDGAVRHSATLHDGLAEIRIVDGAGSILVDGEPIPAATVVLATGVWGHPALERLGVATTIAPDRGQIVHLRTGDPATAGYPVLKPLEGSYLLGFSDGRVVAGATHELVTALDAVPRVGDQADVLADALDAAPGLASSHLSETRIGFRPASGDGYPLIGRTGIDNVFLANGLGSWGLTLGPMLGDVVARQVLALPQTYDAAFLSPTDRSAFAPRTDKPAEAPAQSLETTTIHTSTR